MLPNGELFTNSVTVNTAFAQRRMEYDVGIEYGADIDRARGIILDILQRTEGVDPDPKADVIVVRLAESDVRLRARDPAARCGAADHERWSPVVG